LIYRTDRPAKQIKLLLQITADAATPKTYRSLASTPAPTDQDMALWLAAHYSGLAATASTDVNFHTHFDDAYPAVNRLLPVWQITNTRCAGLVLAFIRV
jgi:hypothetical protein